MELDKLTLVSVREHLLSDKAQHDSGGWLIWGNDQTAGSDIICSCHALIMLQYFRARAQSESDYHLFDMKINRTVDYFLFQRNDRKLWSSPSGDGHDSLQMSAWYFVVLLPFLIEAHPNEVGHTYESLCVWLKPDKQASLEASMMGREIQVRLIYAALVASQLGYQQFDSDAYQVFQNILKDEREIEGLTTYALTRYLILLREFLRVHDSSMSVSKFVLGRVLAMPFPLTDWLRWGIETKQEWARLQRLVD
jgi:hypothetical protein